MEGFLSVVKHVPRSEIAQKRLVVEGAELVVVVQVAGDELRGVSGVEEFQAHILRRGQSLALGGRPAKVFVRVAREIRRRLLHQGRCNCLIGVVFQWRLRNYRVIFFFRI